MKTEESLRILLSLYVTMRQNFDALLFYESYLSENVLKHPEIPSRNEYCIDEAISESLWFQIILKACSFMDEWNMFLAVKTNDNDYEKLLLIKKIVAPARKEVSKWKDLKKFRNEIIAHNLRNGDRSFSMDNIFSYNCPQTSKELYYLIAFIEVMVRVLSVNYKNLTYNVIHKAEEIVTKPKVCNNRSAENLELALKKIKDKVDNDIWLIVRSDVTRSYFPEAFE